MKKISIVVPVYNVEKYLKRCIDSLIRQTYENIEIVLVNDGSKDNSGLICDALAEMDSRIRVFHKKNGGLSDARNYGIEHASGDYLCFVDSDDYISCDYCMKMYEIAIKEDADIVICQYDRFEGERFNDSSEQKDNYIICDKHEALKNLYSREGELYTLAWNKLYKKSVIGDIRYPVGLVNEDEFTTYKFILNSEKIVVLDSVLYYYFRNENSITTANKYMENMDVFKALRERKKVLQECNNMSDIIKLHDKTFLNRIIFRNKNLMTTNKVKYKELLRTYRKYYIDTIGNVKGIGYIIYYICPWVYYRLV